jgi:hypothetical protein
MMDEDDTVKDLTVKTIEELWFQNTTPLPSALKSRTSASLSNPHNKSVLLSKVAVIMGVSANFKDRHSPLEDMLHKIMADKQNETSSLHDRYAEICETLIDGLVDASDLPGFVGSLSCRLSNSLMCLELTARLSLIAYGQSFFSLQLTPPFYRALTLPLFYLT